VTLIRTRLFEFTKQQISRNKLFNLRYPANEKIPIKFEAKVLVELEEFPIKLPIYVIYERLIVEE